jgi:hypothetical protein
VSYNGYLHVIPRLIAWAAEAFPYKDAPFIYNLLAIAMGAASILFFAEKTKSLTPIWITVAVFILVPTNGEEFGDLTNVQWLTQFPLFALAFYPRSLGVEASLESHNTVTRCLCYVVIACLALTGPFSMLCALISLPLFVSSQFYRRYGIGGLLIKLSSDWWLQLDKSNFLLIALGGIVQSVALFFGNRPTGILSFRLVKAAFMSGVQIHILGAELLPPGLFLLTVILAVIATAQLCKKRQFGVAYLIVPIMAVFATMQILGGYPPFLDVASHSLNADRYFFFAKVTFWVCVAAMLHTALPTQKVRRTALVPLALIFIHLCNPGTLQRTTLPDLDWKSGARKLSSQEKVIRIPINPSPWVITIIRP